MTVRRERKEEEMNEVMKQLYGMAVEENDNIQKRGRREEESSEKKEEEK